MDSATTAEQDRHSASQRRVNIIWECTQAVIALSVVFANVAAVFILVSPNGSPLLANAFFLIVGFYFGRTNHAKVGGVNLGR